jgi:hypothetical protein
MPDAPVERLPTLLLVSEPLVSADSVQFRLTVSFARVLSQWFRVTVATTYLGNGLQDRLADIGLPVVAPPHDVYELNRALGRIGNTSEATFWAEAWLREALGSLNRRLFDRLLRGQHFDFTVNASITAAIASDIWWIQGPPLEETLVTMGRAPNSPRWIGEPFVSGIRLIEGHLLRRMVQRGGVRVAGSNYVREYFTRHGISVDRTIYSLADMSGFTPRRGAPGSKYVLAYIGKETEIEPLIGLAKNGIRVVAFGGKLIPGIDSAELRRIFDFRGRVTHQELVELFSNAEFTAFPFSTEALGYVPLESMNCGTPVLTYGREGPAETVVDGRTGWLVQTAAEFVSVGCRLWQEGFDRARFSEESIRRAALFEPGPQAKELAELLLGRSVSPLAPR